MAEEWKIEINNFLGGFAPGWFLSTYPSYGNTNMAGDMTDVDLTNPSVLTQGPGLATLTNGDENDNVSDLIKGILKYAQSSNLAFAVGNGGKFYEITGSAVNSKASDPALPHSISGTNPVGEDVAYFQGEVYYSHYDDNGGDVGKYDLSRDAEGDFDDDWCSNVQSGTVQKSVPLPLEVGGNDFLYLGNKNNVSSWDGTTWTDSDLDLPDNAEIQDIKWNMDRLVIAANQPDLTGSNRVIGSIFIWDGNSDSWENEIRLPGRVGALHIKNGIVYVFYYDPSSTGGYKIGYLDGYQIKELGSFKGGLPTYYQVAEYENLIIWVGGSKIYAFGAVDPNLPAMLFQIADGGHSTVGGLACTFGTPLVASHDGSSAYKLAKFSGYTTTSEWKSILFDATGNGRKSEITRILFNFEKLATGARVDITIKDNKGTTLKTETISYSGDGAVTQKLITETFSCENFRIELDWGNGSTTNDVAIKSIKIYGHTLQ